MVARGGLKSTDWRVLKDDELPDVTSLSQVWECVHCWRAGSDLDLEESSEFPFELTQVREHLRDM